jgi:hypothetical protein
MGLQLDIFYLGYFMVHIYYFEMGRYLLQFCPGIRCDVIIISLMQPYVN